MDIVKNFILIKLIQRFVIGVSETYFFSTLFCLNINSTYLVRSIISKKNWINQKCIHRWAHTVTAINRPTSHARVTTRVTSLQKPACNPQQSSQSVALIIRHIKSVDASSYNNPRRIGDSLHCAPLQPTRRNFGSPRITCSARKRQLACLMQ